MDLPEKFLARMEKMLGEEYPLFLHSTAEKSVRGLRANSLKSFTAKKLYPFFDNLKPILYASDGMIFDDEHIGRHPLHHAGAFYVQDPGAMATVHAAPIKSGWRVADFCAAPGGKSSQLADYIGEDGLLVSNEIDKGRCKVLGSNFERLGISNAIITNVSAEALEKLYPDYFDLVLVDAPCSGEGMFRKYDYAKDEWSEENVILCAKRQREILAHAAKTVKNGGYLLYSTCTFSQEENEKTIDSFLEEHSSFSVCDVTDEIKKVTVSGVPFEGCLHRKAIAKTRRFYPHIAQGEGQFICLMQKNEGDVASSPAFRDASASLSKAEAACVTDFLSDVLEDADALLERYTPIKQMEYIVLKRKDVSLPSEGVYMAGVTLGSYEKGRIEPHHQFFSALGHLCKRKLCLQAADKDVLRYLKGETLSCDLPNGYGVVTVDGCSLGGIKVVNGVAKNHYPKGLRIKGDI